MELRFLLLLLLLFYIPAQEHEAVESRVEGQSLSIECRYDAQDYSNIRKTWCQPKGEICSALVSTSYTSAGSYQNKGTSRRATIEDDTWNGIDDTQKGVVTITMEKLQVDDSGVYWCACYYPPNTYQIIEVKLDVTKAPSTSDVPVTRSTGHTSPVLSTASAELTPTDSSHQPNENTFIILGVVLGLLFILALIGLVVLCTRKSRQLKSRGDGQAEDIYEEPRNAPGSQGFHNMKDPKDDKQEMPQDLNYVTLDFKSSSSPKESVYANIMASQALETPHTWSPSEPVEYANISLKPLASAADQ
ncbi:CMRF35-like molecule 6 [Emydura macquarii macquarii]|uniref:CMRF35-like molecule 6 n=1 Tax=Emydura macquarii macquarii TaxID=1129001 RepID=UPI00352AD716